MEPGIALISWKKMLLQALVLLGVSRIVVCFPATCFGK